MLNGWENNILTLRGETVFGINLPADKQFLLGGENGLRGYSVRQFSGDRKAIFALENRRVLLYDLLDLANLGWAVFADTGGVWKDNQNMSIGDFKSDVGIGLRFAASRSYDPSILRADVAYALNDNGRRSRWVINIGGNFRFGEEERRKFEQ
jgi:outer membrane translocation and assembly module TamA